MDGGGHSSPMVRLCRLGGEVAERAQGPQMRSAQMSKDGNKEYCTGSLSPLLRLKLQLQLWHPPTSQG